MDSPALKIGTSYARLGTPNSSISGGTGITPKPMGNVVNIYFGHGDDVQLFAEAIPEGLLRRFTKTGRDQLVPYKRVENNNTEHVNNADHATTQVGTENGMQTSSDINDHGNGISKLENHQGFSPFNGATSGQIKTMHLEFDVQVYPTKKAFNILLLWMTKNRPIQMPLPVTPLVPPKVHEVNLFTLVDTYAATLAVDLMPRAKELRTALLSRITEVPLLAEDMKTIWARLPHNVHGEGIFMRMVRAYYGHDKAGRLTEDQKGDIWTYTLSEPELDQKFIDVEVEHKQRAEETAAESAKTEERRVAYEQRQVRVNPEQQWQRMWKGGENEIETGPGHVETNGTAVVEVEGTMAGTPKL